jgi:beta-mannosidase
MRANPNCDGGLFWMYEDCWGEIGWTIVDYGLRRKPAWYSVQRAFAPLRLILREDGGNGVRVILANDTRAAFHGDLDYGYISLDGAIQDLQHCTVQAPALSRTECTVFPRGANSAVDGLWIARIPGREDVEPAIFRAVEFRQLRLPRARLSVRVEENGQNGLVAAVSSPVYAHAVRLTGPEGTRAGKNFFDLLPAEERRVVLWADRQIRPEEIRVECVNGA